MGSNLSETTKGSLSKHFITTEVCAKKAGVVFLGTGIMVAVLTHVGRTEWARDRLRREVNTRASWSAHDFCTCPGMPSGIADFLLLSLFALFSVTEWVVLISQDARFGYTGADCSASIANTLLTSK